MNNLCNRGHLRIISQKSFEINMLESYWTFCAGYHSNNFSSVIITQHSHLKGSFIYVSLLDYNLEWCDYFMMSMTVDKTLRKIPKSTRIAICKTCLLATLTRHWKRLNLIQHTTFFLTTTGLYIVDFLLTYHFYRCHPSRWGWWCLTRANITPKTGAYSTKGLQRVTRQMSKHELGHNSLYNLTFFHLQTLTLK